jgi:hypothetical protein
MATLFQVLQFLDGNASPYDGGKVYWYEAGTSTPKNTWVDQAESAIAANPVILGLDGRPDHGSGASAIWIRGSYKMVLKDKNDVTILTLDNINEYDMLDWTGLTATIADLNSTTTTALLKTSAYTVQITDRGKTILCDATSAPFTIDLPAAVTAGNKFKIIIKKIDKSTNAVTIDPASSEKVDDRTTYLLHDYFDFIEVHSNGSNWYVVASQIRGTVLSVTTTYTLALGDNKKLVKADASGGAFDVNLPSAAAVGRGWRITVKKIDVSVNTVTLKPSGAETIDGAATEGISNRYFSITLISDGTNWLIASEYGDNATGGAYPLGYLRGVRCLQNVAAPTTAIDFEKGAARGENNLANLTLLSTMTKTVTSTWEVGTNKGGMPTGIIPTNNLWLHCFLIGKPDGTTDVGYDTSITATNLLSTATGYTDYKRVWSIKCKYASGDIQDMITTVAVGGARITYWKTIDVTSPHYERKAPVPNVGTLINLFTPKDVKTTAIFIAAGDAGTDLAIYFSDPDQDDQAPGFGGDHPLNDLAVSAAASSFGARRKVRTNISSQIRVRGHQAVGAISFYTIGWEE